MTLADALLLFMVIWVLVLLLALAMPFDTQGEAGDVVPGTPASAPARMNLARRLRFTTAIAVLLFGGVYGVLALDLIHAPGLEDVPTVPALPAGGTGG